MTHNAELREFAAEDIRRLTEGELAEVGGGAGTSYDAYLQAYAKGVNQYVATMVVWYNILGQYGIGVSG